MDFSVRFILDYLFIPSNSARELSLLPLVMEPDYVLLIDCMVSLKHTTDPLKSRSYVEE